MTRLTPRRQAEILERIRSKLQQHFPIGCQVRLSALGRQRLGKRYANCIGTVIRHVNGISPGVLWAGRKTTTSYAWEFLQRVRHRQSQKRKDR